MIDVSVILAVHNGYPYLIDAVHSVLGQTRVALEMVVVDDGSTDYGSVWLDEFAKRDSRLKVFRNERVRGLTCCLNQALYLSRGRYIARIDHDDIWLPLKVDKQLDLLEREPELVLVGTSYLEEEVTTGRQFLPRLPIVESDEKIRQAMYSYNPFLHSSIIFRSSILRHVGMYNENYRYSQDYEMWTRILGCGRAHIIPTPLCIRRVSDNNISVRKERAQRLNALRAKVAWCLRNGFCWRVVTPVMQDLLIVILPISIKSLIRRKLHKLKSS